MKWLFTCMFMLLTQLCLHAQTDEDADAVPMLRPRLLALDTTISVANHFNEELSKVNPGYQLAFTDNGQGKTIKKVYKTDKNETLKLEYTYSIGSEGVDESGSKPIIIFQRVCCNAEVMAKIYNYLFGTEIASSQLAAYGTPGIDIEYMGKTHQFILEPDDYGPGYWMMTFLK